MIKRIVSISNPARLSHKNRQMVVEREGYISETVPVEDMGVLILENPAISHTQGLFTLCAECNVAVIFCNRKHLPTAILLPLESNSLHSRTIAKQSNMSQPLRKRLWQAIIKAKINEQAKVLLATTSEDSSLPAYAARVKSGDPQNIEAQAARIYWQRLFGEKFRRDKNGNGINVLLNYGYAIVRAAVARAIVGTGLHPSLGVHHHNQYNSFCLADDMLEPLRPAIDIKVYTLYKDSGGEPVLTPENKQSLLETMTGECSISDTRLPIMVALHHYASSIRKVICGDDKQIKIPAL